MSAIFNSMIRGLCERFGLTEEQVFLLYASTEGDDGQDGIRHRALLLLGGTASSNVQNWQNAVSFVCSRAKELGFKAQEPKI